MLLYKINGYGAEAFRKFRTNSIVSSIALASIFVCAFTLFNPIFFGANDDIGIENFLSAGYDSVFMSVIAGKIIKFGYSIYPQIGFYAVFLLIAQTLALAAILYSFMELAKTHEFPNLLLAIILIVILIFFTKNIIFITFTTTAFLTAFSSLALLIISLKKEAVLTKLYTISGLLFSLAYLIRPEAIMGAILFTLPILIFFFAADRYLNLKKQLKFRMGCILFLLPLLIAFLSEKIAYKYNTSVEHKAFVEFNEMRGEIHGYPIARHASKNKKMLNENGWTSNDYRSFVKLWFFAHEGKYNLTTVSNILKMNHISIFERINGVKSQNLKIHATSLWSQYHLYFMLFISLGIYLLLSKNWKKFCYLAGYAAFLFSAMIFLAEFLRVPDRIAEPLAFGGFLIALFSLFNNEKIHYLKNTKWSYFILAILLLSIGSIKYLEIYKMKIHFIQKQKYLNEQVFLLNKNLAGFVIHSQAGHGSLGLRFKNPLKPRDYEIAPIVIEGGWSTYSPFFYEKLYSGLGLREAKEVLPNFIDNQKALVDGTQRYIEALKVFIFENYGKDVEFIKAPEYGQQSYKLISRNNLYLQP